MKRAIPKASISVSHAGSKKVITVRIQGDDKTITAKQPVQTK